MIVKRNGSALPQTQPDKPVVETEKWMTLEKVQDQEILGSEKVVLYAQEGWGKSTWAANAEKPIFISTENGLKRIKVSRFPDAKLWEHINQAVQELRNNEHQFKTLIIDTADWAEILCHDHLCKANGKESISDFGYGEGFGLAFDEFKKLVTQLDLLREEKTMDIVILAHAKVVAFKNPLGEDYDRFEMKTHKYISTFLKEWADCVLFGSYDTALDIKRTRKGDVIGKAKAVGGVNRIINTCHHAAWDAKNRYDIVGQLPVPKENPAQPFWNLVKGEKS